MILDFVSFTRKGFTVDHVCPAETWGVGGAKAWKEQRVQDHKGGGGRQRDHQPVCNGEVIDP